MKAIELIRWALTLTDEGMARLVSDMRDEALTPATPGGNHTLWCVGHVCVIEGSIPRVLFGEDEDVLYVKGSGWDLETIEAAGFAPVKLDYVRRLAALPALSDPQMVNELATHTLRAGAPAALRAAVNRHELTYRVSVADPGLSPLASVFKVLGRDADGRVWIEKVVRSDSRRPLEINMSQHSRSRADLDFGSHDAIGPDLGRFVDPRAGIDDRR